MDVEYEYAERVSCELIVVCCHFGIMILFVVVYAIATVFQLYHGGDRSII